MATFDPHPNFAYAKVTVAPSPADSGTTFSIAEADAADFPDPATDGEYNVAFAPEGEVPRSSNAEICRVTAKAAPSGGNVEFTITRAQEGTTAKAIDTTYVVWVSITEKVIKDIENMGIVGLARNITPSGTIDGTNTTFTTPSKFYTGSLRVYLNGLKQTAGEHYTEGSDNQSFTMTTAPSVGDKLEVEYDIQSGSFAIGTASWVYDSTENGTITGAVDGSNKTFNLRYTPVSGTLILFRDGQQLFETADYTLSGKTITFVTAPTSGTKLFAFYQNVVSTAGNADLLDGYHASTFLTQISEGWVDAGETWTYASATSFTVSGDVTGKYQKGDKIRLKQGGGYKYFYIIGVSYSSPNTTITITGGTDYSLDNSTITDNYYSKVENPQGFPFWFNTSSVTFDTTTIDDGLGGQPTTLVSKFTIVNNTVYYLLQASGYKVSTKDYVSFDKPLEMPSPNTDYTSYRTVMGTTYAFDTTASKSITGVVTYVNTTSKFSPTFSTTITDNDTIANLSVKLTYEF